MAVEDRCHLFLAGDGQTPLAYLEVSVFGNEVHAGHTAFTYAPRHVIGRTWTPKSLSKRAYSPAPTTTASTSSPSESR